jgi:hypothetical protein
MSSDLKSQIRVGFQVFTKDGGEEVGAVRDLCGHRPEIIVYVENTGDVTVPVNAVTAVHYQKVVVDPVKLPPDVQRAFRRAHDSEEF